MSGKAVQWSVAAAAVGIAWSLGGQRVPLVAEEGEGEGEGEIYERPCPDSRLQSMRLQAVQVISRHGYRAPLRQLPNDASEWLCDTENVVASKQSHEAHEAPLYRTRLISDPRNPMQLSGTCYAGQLMPAGRRQTRAVGRYLRSLYVSETEEDDDNREAASGSEVPAGAHTLLPHSLDAELLYIRSTECKRTIETAQCILAGMYPQHLGHGRRREPVTIHMQDYRIENMYGRSSCKRLQLLKKIARSDPEVLAEREALKSVRRELKEALNAKRLSKSWAGLCNTLACIVGSGMPLPKGVSMELVEKVERASGWELARWNFPTKEICALSIGGFVADLRDLMDATARGALPYRFMLFSGHDNTLSPLLCGLGIHDGRHPPMGSILVFELWKGVSGEQAVRVLFNGQVQQLPGHGTLVPLADFLAVLTDLAPEDLHAACATVEDLLNSQEAVNSHEPLA